MATTINNVLAINLEGLTAAAAQTYTATRPFLVFDAVGLCTAQVAGQSTLTIGDGAAPAVTILTQNPPVVNEIIRLGAVNEAPTSTIDDAHWSIAAGGTVVFAEVAGNTFDVTAMLYPL